jgi:hypothetical protein
MNSKIVKTAMPIHKVRAALNLNPVSLTLGVEELPADIGIHFTMSTFRVKKVATFTMPGDVAKQGRVAN